MLEKLVDTTIVLSHICLHVTRMHGVDGYPTILVIMGELEHGEQLCSLGRSIPFQSCIVLFVPAQVFCFQAGDGEPVAFGVHQDDPRLFLVFQFFLQAMVDDERCQVVDLEDLFDVVRGESFLCIVDTGIMDEYIYVAVHVRKHVCSSVYLVEVGEVCYEIGTWDIEVPLDLLYQFF